MSGQQLPLVWHKASHQQPPIPELPHWPLQVLLGLLPHVPAQTLMPDLQVPILQMSPEVQGLPSSHVLPVLGLLVQPMTGLQPSSVQGLPSLQPPMSLGLLGSMAVPLQVPLVHLSPLVQASPSSQASVLGLCLQPSNLSQLSVVHELLSSHLLGKPPHTSEAQVSLSVQALPSSQGMPSL